MALVRLLAGFSRLLGRRRDLLRRPGGLALLFLGVHAAAQVLDVLCADLLDAVDLMLDDAGAAMLATLATSGLLDDDAAARAADGFALTLDLPEKQWLALRLALATELTLDVMLWDLCWGTRGVHGPTRRDELRESSARLVASLQVLDVERLLAPVVLAGFVGAGAVQAGLALEGPARAALLALALVAPLAGNLAAVLAVVATLLLVARFVPDLLWGAVVRAHERGERARAALARRRAARSGAPPRVAAAVDELRLAVRGGWLVVALAVAALGLGSLALLPLLERLGAPP
ncbi:MAG: hypothetical protein FJ137_09785 [Deltaproteobacteria bacterium]|nr:hypothetical protein [Deltaproteobacteria bacterium]